MTATSTSTPSCASTNAQPAHAAGLLLRGLEVRYRALPVPALAGLDLDVAPGSFHAVLGPSGCGKSTMLKAIAGLVQPSAGRIERGDTDDTAYVPQGDSCFPWLSVEDNIAYGLWVRGAGRRERRRAARGLLERLGLEGFGGRYPATLSEGMRQRVAIARAFAVEAPLLLMDEPLSALDFQTKLRVQGELLALWRDSGATVLYVTHDIDEALTLADRVSVLSARPGRVLATLEVPFARPRAHQRIRREPGYGELFARCFELLGAEAGDEDA